MRLTSVACFALSVLVCAATVSADPIGDLAHVRQTFAALHSVHIEITGGGSPSITADMIEPNKVRASSEGQQVVEIGSTAWINMGGQWSKMPPIPMVKTQMDLARNWGLEKKLGDCCTVTNLGPAMAGGTATIKYRIVDHKNGDTTYVYVANNLPVQIELPGSRGATTTIRYSQYNQVADITPPM